VREGPEDHAALQVALDPLARLVLRDQRESQGRPARVWKRPWLSLSASIGTA
jgi:hypothetical protein